VSVKLETVNPVRSFKARGTELVASLLTEQGRTAVACATPAISARRSLGQVVAVASM